MAGIAQADHVARWNGSAWSAVGANSADTDGWFPASAFINGDGQQRHDIYATGSFQNANGDPTADFIASFDGTRLAHGRLRRGRQRPLERQRPRGRVFGGKLVAGGNFTSAGGDTKAQYVAQYPGEVTLSVTKNGNGNGAVEVTNGVFCGGQCPYHFPIGTPISLNVYTNFNARFTGWGGACSGTALNCSFTLNADTAVTANFIGIPTCSPTGPFTATGGEATRVRMWCQDYSGFPIVYAIVTGPKHGTLGPLGAEGGAAPIPG